MTEIKVVLVFKWPIFLIPFSFPALNSTFSPYLLLYVHSSASSEGTLADTLDLHTCMSPRLLEAAGGQSSDAE